MWVREAGGDGGGKCSATLPALENPFLRTQRLSLAARIPASVVFHIT
jgi:hypothetical protein